MEPSYPRLIQVRVGLGRVAIRPNSTYCLYPMVSFRLTRLASGLYEHTGVRQYDYGLVYRLLVWAH